MIRIRPEQNSVCGAGEPGTRGVFGNNLALQSRDGLLRVELRGVWKPHKALKQHNLCQGFSYPLCLFSRIYDSYRIINHFH